MSSMVARLHWVLRAVQSTSNALEVGLILTTVPLIGKSVKLAKPHFSFNLAQSISRALVVVL